MTSSLQVEFIDKMGTDLSVVNAARVSYAKFKDSFEDKDEKLIKFLAEHNHWSPFAHASLQIRIKAPVFVARQLVKHQVGLVWNEISRRYVNSDPEFYEPQEWRGRAEDKKQGSDGIVFISDDIVEDLYDDIFARYKLLLDLGVCPEQARMILPQSTMTEWYWSGSLFALAKMCSLRTSSDAQYESKKVASKISDTMLSLYPVSWNALRTTMYKGDE